MENFEKRRDRFELFNSFENPLLNITFSLEVPEFRPFCRKEKLPPFHFFLFALFRSILKVENFRYRIYQGSVIKIDRLIPSYTVMNTEGDLNFTRFEYSSDLETFIQRSLTARDEATNSSGLLHSATNFTEREIKDYVFVTSIPWLEFTSIQHPTARLRATDIPSIAWGKFRESGREALSMPFSVQAHHGFVDGYHIHLLAETLKGEIASLISK